MEKMFEKQITKALNKQRLYEEVRISGRDFCENTDFYNKEYSNEFFEYTRIVKMTDGSDFVQTLSDKKTMMITSDKNESWIFKVKWKKLKEKYNWDLKMFFGVAIVMSIGFSIYDFATLGFSWDLLLIRILVLVVTSFINCLFALILHIFRKKRFIKKIREIWHLNAKYNRVVGG